MAQEPNYFKGKDLFLSLNGIMIGCDTSTTVSLNTTTFNNGSKCTVDSLGNLYGSSIVTMTTAEFSGSGFTVLDISESGGSPERSTASLMDLCLKQTKCFASYKRGNNFYGCDVYISKIDETSKYDEIAAYTYTLVSCGPIFRINPS